MKITNFNLITFLFLSLTLVLSNCKKKDDLEEDPGPSCTNYITQEDIVIVDSTSGNSESTARLVYSYNSSNQVRKITKSNGGIDAQYDSIFYNSDGKVDSIATVDLPATLKATQKYYYSGGKLDSIIETGTNSGPYERVRKFTYSGSELASMELVYTSGSPDTDELVSLTGITYTSGSITSGNAGALGTVTVQNDSYPNPYKTLNIYNQDAPPMRLFSANNPISAYSSLDPATPLLSIEYTYQDGKVKTIRQGEVGNYSTTSTLTISCK